MPGIVSPVALRKESVDRNTQRRDFKALGLVALRKESVDRNASKPRRVLKCDNVALRKESVDRNNAIDTPFIHCLPSLSARRAWIEISTQCKL